jgi:hypothetical protein
VVTTDNRLGSARLGSARLLLALGDIGVTPRFVDVETVVAGLVLLGLALFLLTAFVFDWRRE